MLRDILKAKAVTIGRKHVATLMKRVGIEAIYQIGAGGMGCAHCEELIELVICFGGVSAKGAVFQVLAPVPNPYTPSQIVADFRREDAVATVDRVVYVAQNMDQANLVVFGNFLLPA